MKDLFEQFWNQYPYRVSKGIAIKSFEKVVKENGEEICDVIKLAIQAQLRYRNEAQASNQFMPNWKMPATWLNQQCWLDEIPSHANLKDLVDRKKCSVENCVSDTIGDRFDVCSEHYADKYCDFSDNIKYLKENNLYKTKDETIKEWRDRCRAYLKQTGFSKWLKNATSAENQTKQN